jgi:ubiquinone/menaquinone biosynthesis C-methylase UbiE
VTRDREKQQENPALAMPQFPSTFQFERTRAIRSAVYRMARLSLRRAVLDVGAGDAPVAEEMAAHTGRRVFALDLESGLARREGVVRVRGDAHALPFGDGTLDAVAYHFVLLWLQGPVQALREAARVLAPGGVVLILSEPDMTRRVEEPETGLGPCLAKVVERSGGHPGAGKLLPGWLEEAGFRPHLRETSEDWTSVQDQREITWEIAFLQKTGVLTPEGAAELQVRERAAEGRRRVLLPLAYGVGLKG